MTQLEFELARQNARNPGEVPADPKSQKVYMLLETPHLGHVYTGGPNGSRFFAGRLLIVNLTPQPMTLKREDFKLEIDGAAQDLKEVGESLKYQGIQVGRQHVQLETVSSFKELKVAAGGTGTGWIFVPDLPIGGRVPKMVLELNLGQRKEKIDINAQQRAALGLEVTYLGPRNCLALFTISGELNMINLGSLMDEFERLAGKKIGRAVVAWTDSAPPLAPELHAWLEQWANSRGQNEYNTENFPAIPGHLKEIHLARMPRHDTESVEEPAEFSAAKRVHKTEAEAVRAAMQTACETMPRDELISAMEKGHPWSRAAVLAFGAARLPADKLPLILRYADDSDPAIQAAALMGLRHFGEPEAVAKLLEFVRKNTEPLSKIAITSLASSRFPAANEALLAVVKAEPIESQKTIVAVLAQYPRQIWSDLLFDFTQSSDFDLNHEALRGLQRVGHPKLVKLLAEMLTHSDERLKNQAFAILISRTDRESEQIAVNYTLEQLKTVNATPDMLMLLARVKDQRAMPLLLDQLKRNDDKDLILDTLAQLGDQTLIERLLPMYDTLPVTGKAKLLTLIRKWDQARFRELAKTALSSPESLLMTSAIQGLVDDGSPAAIQLLIEAMAKNPETDNWSFLCNALGQLGSEPGRQALLKARSSDDVRKRDVAIAALQQIDLRSPALPEIHRGREKMLAGKFEEARSFFSQAIQKDPSLTAGYLGRAECFRSLSRWDDAKLDYEKISQLDPFTSDGATGLSLIQIAQGQVVEAIQRLEQEDRRTQDFHHNEGRFHYNAACVYSRACEYLEQHADFPNRAELKTQYTAIAIQRLKSAIRKDFTDFEHMAVDPDLNALKSNAEFKRILELREAILEEEPEPPKKVG